jgi:hypothetical protein
MPRDLRIVPLDAGVAAHLSGLLYKHFGYSYSATCTIHERRWRDRAGSAGCGPRGTARSGPPSSGPLRAARRSGEWVTEPDPRGLRPATGPARHPRLPFVNNAG